MLERRLWLDVVLFCNAEFLYLLLTPRYSCIPSKERRSLFFVMPWHRESIPLIGKLVDTLTECLVDWCDWLLEFDAWSAVNTDEGQRRSVFSAFHDGIVMTYYGLTYAYDGFHSSKSHDGMTPFSRTFEIFVSKTGVVMLLTLHSNVILVSTIPIMTHFWHCFFGTWRYP